MWDCREKDARTQGRVGIPFGAITGLLILLVAYLSTFSVSPAALARGLNRGARPLALDGIGWRLVSALFNRERLLTGTRSR